MSSKSVAERLASHFGTRPFGLEEAYKAVPDVPTDSVRGRIYEAMKKNIFSRLGRGMYAAVQAYRDETGDTQAAACILLNTDGRDLDFLRDESMDAIITDHPYRLDNALKGGNRDFASYELFQYASRDFDEKIRVLKSGCFLAEFIPEESAMNYEYLYRLKEMAMSAGFLYYAKVPWKKGLFVANTGRKSGNTEDILIFSKGTPRKLRPDAKKDKAEPGVRHFMSGAGGMLPTCFDVAPPDKKSRIHQAEKPVELLKQLIRYITTFGEWVLDQFAGSGSTGLACLETGRNCILAEKDPRTAVQILTRANMAPLDQILA